MRNQVELQTDREKSTLSTANFFRTNQLVELQSGAIAKVMKTSDFGGQGQQFFGRLDTGEIMPTTTLAKPLPNETLVTLTHDGFVDVKYPKTLKRAHLHECGALVETQFGNLCIVAEDTTKPGPNNKLLISLNDGSILNEKAESTVLRPGRILTLRAGE